MIEIGGKPILWHIMKLYSHYGFNDFIICLGYKGYMIKKFFADYYLHTSDVTFDFSNGNRTIFHSNSSEPWRVTLVDTGLNTQTGGRIKRIRPYTDGEPFFMTYGDGVSDLNIRELLAYHRRKGGAATLTAVQPSGRFGIIETDEEEKVSVFREKALPDGGWINAGFMVLEQEVFNYIGDDDQEVFEIAPLENLAKDGKLVAYKYGGFWKCMDTPRDKYALESLWEKGDTPWKVWQ
jgi:glucose-1-phosphate cytidylyltransferase